jgi:hypothetical protein
MGNSIAITQCVRDTTKDKEKSKELADERRQKLQEKFLQINKQNSNKNKSIKTNTKSKELTTKADKQILQELNKYKKEHSKISTRNKQLEKKIDIIQKVNNDLKEENRQIKKDIFNLKGDMKLISDENNLLKQDKIQSVERYDLLLNQYTELVQEQENNLVVKKMKKVILKLRKLNCQYLSMNNNLQRIIANYEQQIDLFKSYNYDEEINQLKAKNLKLSEQLRDLKLKYIPQKVVNKQKKNTIVKVKDIQILSKISLKSFKQNNIISNRKQKQDNSIFGYIVLHDDDKYYLNAIDGNCYEFETFIDETLIDTPAKAKIEEDKAKLLKIYLPEVDNGHIKQNMLVGNYKIQNDNSKEKIAKLDVIDKEKIREELQGMTVLIIGSRFKDKYKNMLLSYGLNVLWHDTFEENESRIMYKANKADVVIICTSHIKHAVMAIIDKDNPKFQLIEKDTSESILARIRFGLITMELI